MSFRLPSLVRIRTLRRPMPLPPAPGAPRTSRKARIALLMLLACIFVLCTAWLDGGADIAPSALWHHSAATPWWNTPLLLLWTRRAGLSLLLAFGVEALLYGVNALKMRNLAVPLMPADFRMLGQLRHGGGDLLAGYVPAIPWLILALAACVAALAALVRFEPPLLARHPRRGRAIGALALAAALVTLLAGMPAWGTVYNKQRLGMQPWSAAATRQHTGLISSLLLFHLQFKTAQKHADVPAALRLMARYEPEVSARTQPASGADAQKPDIVVILSESFFDPAIMNGWPEGTDLTPNLHRLARHGISGQLHVPTFGGGTIRTEFEVLTGLSLRYFPDVQFPYLQIHQKKIPGIVRTLDQQGYLTLAVHGNQPGFWNRTQAFRELGFGRFISIGDFPAADKANDGNFMSDKAFTDELLRQLPDEGSPRFVLGISIEAHGPYDYSAGIDTRARDAIPVPASVTDPYAQLILRNYIYHMQHADQQLGRLIDTLAQRKRRTLVLFFGDHLPALVPAYQQAGFRNGGGF